MSKTQSFSLVVNDVSKHYAKYKSPLFRLMNWLGCSIKPTYEYWANSDISFSLESGRAIAIIGQNGAGKSTLLKMIAGTVRPTKGTISVTGRVSAMLELGLGFNHEFTGRQNAYLSGGLMGLSKSELDTLMPSIEEFAEIGTYFDQPLRVYSSGMQARLAFSVATAVRPDILIVDEILSVGDSYFQHRSFDRIRQFKAQGTTIIMVTHSIADVRTLCDQVVLLDKGKVLKIGPTDEIVDYYNAMIAQKESIRFQIEQSRGNDGWLQTKSGDGSVEVNQLVLRNQISQNIVSTVRVGEPLHLICEVKVNHDIDQLVLGVMLRDKQGHTVWGSNTWHTAQVQRELKKGDLLSFQVSFNCNLGPGSYSFTTALTEDQTHLGKNYEWSDNSLVFDVVNFDHYVFVGSNWLPTTFQIERNR